MVEIQKYRDDNEELPSNLTDFFTVEEEAKFKEMIFGQVTDEERQDLLNFVLSK